MRTDGRFIIQSGQGITQGIQQELGLSNQECKELQQKSIWTQIINEFEGETNGQANMTVTDNGNKTANKANNYFVYANAVVEFSKECWQRIVNLVNNALNKNIEIEDVISEDGTTSTNETKTTQNTELTSLMQSRQKAHQKVVEEAVKIIEENWDISGLGDKFKTEEDKQLYLKCLKEVSYNAQREGAGHAELGIVHIETNNEKLKTTSEMLKLLIHEANHAFRQRKILQNGGLNYPTKAEEIECETLALITTSKLINAGKIDDYEIYGQNISEYTNTDIVQNNPEFQNWVNGYCQLADNLDGDITVTHNPYVNDIENLNSGNIEVVNDNDVIIINGNTYKVSNDGMLIAGKDNGRQINISQNCQIKAHGKVYNLSVSELKLTESQRPNLQIKGGDVLKIEGQEFVIGKDRMLEGTHQTSLMQIIVHHEDFSSPDIYGYLEFDDVKLTEQEKNILKDENINYEKMKRVPFVIVQADGKEIRGTCFIPQ